MLDFFLMKWNQYKNEIFLDYFLLTIFPVNINSLFIYPKEWYALGDNRLAVECDLG